MTPLSVVNINPFLAAHWRMIPMGRVLFLGAAHGREIVHLAAQGYAVHVADTDAAALAQARALVAAAGLTVHWQRPQQAEWRLGFEQWAGIVALFPRWTPAQGRQLLRAIPCALQPGGRFLFEAHAEGAGGPVAGNDDEFDAEDVRKAIDVLHLSRFATVRSQRHGNPARVLQVIGSHLAVDSEWLNALPLKAVRGRGG